MDLYSDFKKYLFSQQPALSSITVKNYLSDLQKFFTWYKDIHNQSFSPYNFSEETILVYKTYLLSIKSSDRHISTLRKFGKFLVESSYIKDLPKTLQGIDQAREDDYALNQFKNLLYHEKASDATISNYIIDTQQFLHWLTSVVTIDSQKEAFLGSLSSELIQEYRERLLAETVPPATINRKLSSLRKYVGFLEDTYPKQVRPIVIHSISYNNEVSAFSQNEQSNNLIAKPGMGTFVYSQFPPFRFFQKVGRGISFLFDWIVISPLADLILYIQYVMWLLSGKKLFVPGDQIQPNLIAYVRSRRGQNRYHRSFSASFFFPFNMAISKERHTFIYKAYKKYHRLLKNPFFSLFHYGVLFLLISLLVTYTYNAVFHPNHLSSQVLGISTSQRMLSFHAKLLDEKQQPITVPTPVRFSLYTDPTASKSALLWQEVRIVNPSRDGSFSITLGANKPISSSLFSDNPSIYLGTTIANNSELRPRNPIPTVGLSNDSQTLEGMKVLTENTTNPRNSILALDSTGSLYIGGTLSPTFSATNGIFTLSGQQLLLTTNVQSNGNLTLSPDGFGQIDLQKPLTNTSTNGNMQGFAGAVEVDDRFGVLATTSAMPAVQISQNFIGPLISASSSGVNKFLVDYVGSGTFANDLAVNGTNLTTTSPNFNLLNSTVAQIQFGQAATDISIGNTSGTTTINNATTALSGNVSVGGATGATFTADGAGIQFGGQGDHLLVASQGALLIDAATLNDTLNVANNVSIVPSSNDGTSNLGSSDNHFGTLYVNNIVSSNLPSLTNYWSLNNNVLSPSTNTNPLSLLGNVGIGTLFPDFKLNVIDSQDATASAFIVNQTIINNPNASALALQLGSKTTTGSNHFINFLNGNGEIVGSIQGNANNGITLQGSASGDFAEFLPKDPTEDIPAGSLVCFADTGKVTECNSSFTTIAGAVSTTPTILAGNDQGDASVTVGLQGQIKIRVSTRNGDISPGDPIAASNIPGVGVKATSAGPIIGHALAAYDNTDPYIIDNILALVQPAWFDPSIRLTDTGNLTIVAPDNSQPQESQSFSLVDTYNNILTTSAAYSSAMIANLETGMLKAQTLIVSGDAHVGQLFADSIVVGGTSLQDYITNVVEQLQSKSAIPQLASTPQIQTNIISPLASNSAVLVRGNLQISNNASVGGQLTAQNIQAQDATIEGTLRVKKLIADEIEGNQIATASDAATYITNIYNATPSSTPSQTLADQQSSDAASTSAMIASQISLQQLSSQSIQTHPNYINIPAITTQFTNVTQSFMSMGSTSLADTAVAGQLSIDSQLVLADNSINVLGANLELQPFRQGGVDFLSGLVAIDTSGNLKVAGNAFFNQNLTVNGTLATNVISPLSNNPTLSHSPNNLTVQLGTNSALLVNNASNSSVLSFNQNGDVLSSGSANFGQVVANALTIVRGAQADTSSTETIASASAGTAVIYKGQIERTIVSPFVKASSLIYITPTSDTYGVTPYIARQTDGQCPISNVQCPTDQEGSFTIQVPSIANQDIHLNWWIVN